jgi:hypothetical protein
MLAINWCNWNAFRMRTLRLGKTGGLFKTAQCTGNLG